MPAAAASGADGEVFAAGVGSADFPFPQPEGGFRNPPGEVGTPVVQRGLPEEPLVRHPDTPVPVAVRAPVGRGAVKRGESGVGKRPASSMVMVDRGEIFSKGKMATK